MLDLRVVLKLSEDCFHVFSSLYTINTQEALSRCGYPDSSIKKFKSKLEAKRERSVKVQKYSKDLPPQRK